MPLISVIVPVYKVEQYLPRCIDSIINQDWQNYELILVDDGSPDRCGEICDEYAAKDSRIRVIHKNNGGQSSAQNLALDVAEGEYICFVDSDDYVKESYLSYLFSLFSHCDDCKIVQANHYIVRRDDCTQNFTHTEGFTVFTRKEAAEAVLYHDRIDVSSWGKCYDRSVFDNLRFPNGRIYEDTCLFGDLLTRTNNVVYGNDPQYYYVMHDVSTVHGHFSEDRLLFIESAERLSDIALQIDPALQKACNRRRVHARLSVLRYMEHCPTEYKPLRDRLRKEALQLAPEVCALPRIPKRDKIALHLLKLGYFPFYKGWNLYSQFR